MNPNIIRRFTPIVLTLALISLACQFNTKLPSSATQAAPNPSGNQNLPDPSANLGSLSAYQATLTVGFSGTQAGSPSQWTNVYNLAVDPARGTRLVSITSSGLPAESSLDGWIAGTYAGMTIERAGAGAPCEARKTESGSTATGMELSAMLPPVTGATQSGTEQLEGQATQHFSFDQAAIKYPGKGKVNGEMWLAASGGYLVKYSLSVDGGPDLLGQDMQGVMTWEYRLTNINGNVLVDLPEGCPPGLIEAPLMDGAQAVTDQPGLQEFDVASDLKGVMSFYQDKLAALGYTLQEQPVPGESLEQLTFTKPGYVLNVLVETGTDNTSHVLVTLKRGDESASPATTPEATATTDVAADQATRLAKALSLLMVSGDKPSPLASYHLEVNETVPALDQQTGKVKVSKVQVTADVDGTNYYIKHTQDQKVINDGYMIAGQESDVKNGQISPGLGLLAVEWASWPMDMLMPYTIASLGPTAQGQEQVDGRSADVFALDSAKANPTALSAIQSMSPFSNMSLKSASGTVWLDQQTGAELKLHLVYTGEIKNSQGASLGMADGSIDLSVTQVGKVTVKLP